MPGISNRQFAIQFEEAIALKMLSNENRRLLATRADIDELIHALYARLMKDAQIGKFFTEVVPLDLGHHIPKIASFWENLLFQAGDYQGEPMSVHLHLNQISKLEPTDFEVWLGHFDAVVDERFVGEVAERAKQRAHSIAMLMQIKIARDNNLKFL
jgi:hemoglobin